MNVEFDYPQPHVACDVVVFDFDFVPFVLLIKRRDDPFKGMWALPGGHLDVQEELDECAARELCEETGLDIPPRYLNQAFTVGKIDRDPRGRIISVVYTTVVNRSEHTVCAGDDAMDAAWFTLSDLPELAADHLEIIRKALGEIYHDPI